MKKLITVFAFVCLAVGARAQNLTTVSGANITDINGTKLAAGQVCFLITDNSDTPISVSIGGGGQALKRGYCSAVTAGVITGFTVPNPSATSPTGIYYRVTVKDSSTGQEVLRYTLVSFTGATFNFDNYAPTNLAAGAPLSGTTVSGNLSGNGNATFTGTVTGSNIPSSILQQIFSSGVGQTQRTAFNMFAGLTCSDNAGTTRTDCRLGGLTTVTFSATPTFDASTSATFKLTLTGNVTSSTLSNAVAGEPISIEICQDATGGRTFVAPANMLGFGPISTTANACTAQDLAYDGTNAVATGPAMQGTSTIVTGIAFGDTTTAAPGLFRNSTTPSEVKVGVGSNGVNTGAGISVPTQNTDGAALGNSGVKVGGLACYQAGSGGLNSFGSFTADAFLSRAGAANKWRVGTSCTDSSGEVDMRTLGITGSSSGTTSVVTDAAASGTVTLKAGTYNIVGDTLTQPLTGKTLTGATTGNNVSVLNAQGATTAITGTGADAVIYTYSLPANTIDTTSKAVLVSCAATHNSGTANPSVKININGVNAVTGNIGTSALQSVNFEAKILRTSTTAGGSKGLATVTGALNPFSLTLAGLAWTSAQTITCTFNVAATDQMTGVMFMVEQIQ